MENPFEEIVKRLERIENLLNNMSKNPNAISSDRLMNIDEVANYLSVTKGVIYKLSSTNEIPKIKRAKRLYFRQNDIDEWLNKNKVITNDDIDRMATDYILRNPRKKF